MKLTDLLYLNDVTDKPVTAERKITLDDGKTSMRVQIRIDGNIITSYCLYQDGTREAAALLASDITTDDWEVV